MKIFGTIDPDQLRLSKELQRAEALFLGTCKGVALIRRGPNDPHVCFYIVTEDDGSWFPLVHSASWYWAEDIRQQLDAARKWLDENAIQDPFGYRFK